MRSLRARLSLGVVLVIAAVLGISGVLISNYAERTARVMVGFERILQAFRDFQILMGNYPVCQLDDRDFTAEAAEHLAELKPQIVAAQREQMRGHLR